MRGAGGERYPRYGLLPCLPQAGINPGCLVCAFPGASVLLRPTAPARSRWQAAGYAGKSGQPTRGAWRAAAFAAAVASPPWVQRPLWGGGGPPSLWPAPGRPRAWGGGEGGGTGGGEWGSPLSPSGPLAPPLDGRRGAGLVVPVPGGQLLIGGAYSLLASPQPLGAGPSHRPSLGSPARHAVAARCRLAKGGGARGGGGGGDVCWGRWSGSAVSG